jgi:hypothetical protein
MVYVPSNICPTSLVKCPTSSTLIVVSTAFLFSMSSSPTMCEGNMDHQPCRRKGLVALRYSMICGPEVYASRMWVCHVARRKARKVVERVVEMRERWECSVRSKAMVGGVVNAVMGGEVGRKREGGEVWKFLVCVSFYY